MASILINSSNINKQAEFTTFFEGFGLHPSFTKIDIEEPNSSPEDIISYKASRLYSRLSPQQKTYCEDSALFIDGTDEAGVNIRWVMDHINKYAGAKAKFVVLMAYSDGVQVHIFKGEIAGTICASEQPSSFGFDPNFIPEGRNEPYSVSKPPELNPRYWAIRNIAHGKKYRVTKHMDSWTGEMQRH